MQGCLESLLSCGSLFAHVLSLIWDVQTPFLFTGEEDSVINTNELYYAIMCFSRFTQLFHETTLVLHRQRMPAAGLLPKYYTT